MSTEILEELKQAIVDGDEDSATTLARKVVEEKTDPFKAVDAMTSGIRLVGEAFSRGELFLPDMMMAANATQKAMAIVQEEIRKTGKEVKRKSIGTVVIGTVYGDIHNIGKDLVAALLGIEGFEVFNLGVDLPAEKFVEAIKENNPRLCAMSALMTTTVREVGKVIDAIGREGLRGSVKTIVGGGGVTADFARNVGADGYASNAPDGARLAKRLTAVEQR